jgi:hypothetical protein
MIIVRRFITVSITQDCLMNEESALIVDTSKSAAMCVSIGERGRIGIRIGHRMIGV